MHFSLNDTKSCPKVTTDYRLAVLEWKQHAFINEFHVPSKGPPGASMLEKYPLVVAMTDGRVQRVCSHPDDDTWAINMKKGVASALQISLPSLSTSNSGLNLTEVT